MRKPVDRDENYMKNQWGTVCLITDVGSEMILNSNLKFQKHNFQFQKEIHQKIRNDDDYDDWEYGTEPIPGTKW